MAASSEKSKRSKDAKPARDAREVRDANAASDGLPRCVWAEKSAIERDYHDAEWGVPLRDDRALFELLCLEGMQAGLSWQTVLRKREGYRRAFARFDVGKVARMSDTELESLLNDDGLIRHRGKLSAIRDNARVVTAHLARKGALSALLWSFVAGEPRDNRRAPGRPLPATTPESEAMSRALRKQGFRFVGPTTCYAFMQASGMVNDHVLTCFRHDPVAKLAAQGR